MLNVVQSNAQVAKVSNTASIKSFFYKKLKNVPGELVTNQGKKNQLVVNITDLVRYLLDRDVQTHYYVISAICKAHGHSVPKSRIYAEAKALGLAGHRHEYCHNGKIRTRSQQVAAGYHVQNVIVK